MQKIPPHLWFDKEAIDAASFYVSTFPKSRVRNTTQLRNTPSGSVDGDDREIIDQVTQAFLVMKKLDIAKLQVAYEGK